jgi:hypothetical protein
MLLNCLLMPNLAMKKIDFFAVINRICTTENPRLHRLASDLLVSLSDVTNF